MSKYALKAGTYKKGSAQLTPNSSQLVNKLWVKGGKALSDVYSQAITVGAAPIPLHYSPRAPVTVTIGSDAKTLGIQNIHELRVLIGDPIAVASTVRRLLLNRFGAGNQRWIGRRRNSPLCA